MKWEYKNRQWNRRNVKIWWTITNYTVMTKYHARHKLCHKHSKHFVAHKNGTGTGTESRNSFWKQTPSNFIINIIFLSCFCISWNHYGIYTESIGCVLILTDCTLTDKSCRIKWGQGTVSLSSKFLWYIFPKREREKKLIYERLLVPHHSSILVPLRKLKKITNQMGGNGAQKENSALWVHDSFDAWLYGPKACYQMVTSEHKPFYSWMLRCNSIFNFPHLFCWLKQWRHP